MDISILESLRQVESEMFDNLHPIAKEPVETRESYAIGYTMLVCVNGYPSEFVKKLLKREIQALDLPAKYRKTAIDTALSATPETVYQILSVLNDSKLKYIFMLDIYEYAFQDNKVTEQEQEFLLLFERLLEFNADELHFVRGFRLAMLKKDPNLASKVVDEAVSCELKMPIEELQYFLKTLEFWKHETPKENGTPSAYHAKVRQ